MKSTVFHSAVFAAVACSGSITLLSPAAAHSPQVRAACTSDYLNYCSQFNPDSFQTTQCMQRNQRRLSGACRSALAQAGYGAPTERRTANRQR